MKKLAICFAALVPLMLLALAYLHHLRLTSSFARVEHGTSQAEVVSALGEPSSVSRCGSWSGSPAVGCSKEFAYLSILAFTDVWVVSFDANDKAVQKHRYRSP